LGLDTLPRQKDASFKLGPDDDDDDGGDDAPETKELPLRPILKSSGSGDPERRLSFDARAMAKSPGGRARKSRDKVSEGDGHDDKTAQKTDTSAISPQKDHGRVKPLGERELTVCSTRALEFTFGLGHPAIPTIDA
jgi:hypothetical protein